MAGDPRLRRCLWLPTDKAAALADRVAVIRDGVIVADGSPADLGGRAATAAVVSWAGSDGWRSERTDEPTAWSANWPPAAAARSRG